MILSSGIPQYTEKHAEEICELSLELISEALTFKTPLAPELNVSPKIAIHSGRPTTVFRSRINTPFPQTVPRLNSRKTQFIWHYNSGHISKLDFLSLQQC